MVFFALTSEINGLFALNLPSTALSCCLIILSPYLNIGSTIDFSENTDSFSSFFRTRSLTLPLMFTALLPSSPGKTFLLLLCLKEARVGE